MTSSTTTPPGSCGSATPRSRGTTAAARRSAAAVLLALAAACDGGRAAPEPVLLRVTASDFAFEAPDSVPAGPVRLVMHNVGPSYHHVQVLRLDTEVDWTDAISSMRADGAVPEGMTAVGGAEGADSIARDVTVELSLAPGRYLLICRINAPDGRAHAVHGMVRPLVAYGDAAPRAMAAADTRITLQDYAFMAPDTLAAGTLRVLVRNDGREEHHVAVARLAPGKTLTDAMQDPAPGSAPAMFVLGGTAGLAPGEENLLHITLEPGEHALFCFVTSPGSGTNQHYKLGMVRRLTVVPAGSAAAGAP